MLRRIGRTGRPHAGIALLVLLLGLFSAATALADSVGPISFESPTYHTGTINGQDGWLSLGSAGLGCATYDHTVATQSLYPSFGGQSLRMSSAVTSGCFGDQTFSKPLANEAGESGAANNGLSGGSRKSHFEATWQFGSVNQLDQPGQHVVASPDRGDGARMSWVEMLDTPTGLEVDFNDYVDAAPFGSASNLAAGCGVEDDFQLSVVAANLSRSSTHTIKLTMDFVAGPRNDVVNVFVDGTLMHTGTSWEDYFRYCEATNTSRTVDSLLLRTGGDASSNMGLGYYIDNLSLVTANVPASKDDCKGSGWQNFSRGDGSAFKNQGDCIQYANTGK